MLLTMLRLMFFLIHYTLVVTSGLLQCTTLGLLSPSIRRSEMPLREFHDHSIVLIGISSHPFSASILQALSLTENGSAQCKVLYTVSSPLSDNNRQLVRDYLLVKQKDAPLQPFEQRER